jgi:hypothetical protein
VGKVEQGVKVFWEDGHVQKVSEVRTRAIEEITAGEVPEKDRSKDLRSRWVTSSVRIFVSPRMPPFVLPSGYSRIRVVNSFDELISTPFGDGVNGLCWPRTLAGHFDEIVACLDVGEGITTLDDEHLRALPLSAAGQAARDILLQDQERLRAHGLEPVLDCINGCPRDDESAVVPTDVYSFHADSATAAADTWLCSYHVSATEGLRNDEAKRRVDVPETRARLLELYGGQDDAGFREFLQENCYDLHYAPLPHARPFSFGLGNLWRIAVDYPGSPVPPCIHRAPETVPGQPPRLLLLS